MDKQAATDWLNETWLELRNGKGKERRAYFMGAADAFKDIGLLTGEERDEWAMKTLLCPGHDGETGREWCAYGCLGRSESPWHGRTA